MRKLNLNWQKPEVIPTIISGADALMLYNSIPESAKNGVSYDGKSKTIWGSSPLVVATLDFEAQKYGARTVNLRDLSRPEVMNLAKDKYLVDARNLVIRLRDCRYPSPYPRNESLLKTICELAEQHLGRISDKPFMIEGFTFVPNLEDREGYRLTLVPTAEFKVIEDERLHGKYHELRFSEVDELGLPKFDKSGSRKWYAEESGLFGLRLVDDLGLSSRDKFLWNTNRGQVVLVSSIEVTEKIRGEK